MSALDAGVLRALECVREWTQIDGRLVLRGRDLADFRDQLADVISGRAS